MAVQQLRHLPRCLSRAPFASISPIDGTLRVLAGSHAALRLRQPNVGQPRLFTASLSRNAEIIVQVPQMAESINEGTLASFLKEIGERVDMDEELATIETDKIDVSVNAPKGGVLREVFVAEGDVVTVGQKIARIETGEEGSVPTRMPADSPPAKRDEDKPAPLRTGAHGSDGPSNTPSTAAPPPSPPPNPPKQKQWPSQQESRAPAPAMILGRGPLRTEREEKLTRIRKTIATRLKQSQNNCASLTTVQQVDMSSLKAWRSRYKEEVMEKQGVRLGFMGAFTRATTLAAQQIPEVNASIDMEREVITFRDYVDISIAVSTPKGLVTPVLRNCEAMGVLDMERQIAILAQKARENKLTMDDLEGGNFTISNPGIFGSMFGTPLINYPQAAVFNLNSIKDQPVVVNGKIEIRPMMYITLTYDHRLIDGREAVSFLNIVKGYVEDPARMLLV